MEIIETKLNDCLIIKPKVHMDDRGFFFESFNQERYLVEAGIKEQFVQDNLSRSSKNVLRGMHFQKKKPQGKLVSVLKGEVFDVAVDLRPESSTFGNWDSAILSEKNKYQMWVPPGFAHGFYVLTNTADFNYKCTDYYDPSDEVGLLWNDPSINIEWPAIKPILAQKDINLPLFSELNL